MTFRGRSITTPVLLLLVTVLIAGSALAVVAVRGGEPTSLVAKDPGGGNGNGGGGDGGVSAMSQPPQATGCAPGEPKVDAHIDFEDLAGGNLTAAAAMQEWLDANSYGLGLLDVVSVVPGGANPLYAEYEYRTTQGATIARFGINFVGDSWHVTDWEGCADQIATIIQPDEAPDSP